MAAMSETELVSKIIAGEELAIKDFVHQNKDLVFKTCLGYVRNLEDAADLTQEVFIQAIASVKSFKASSKLSTWLYRIAANKSINFIRDNKKHKAESIDSTLQIEDKSGDPHSELENINVKIALDTAIDKLPENQKKVFILHKYNQYSYKQIAEITGFSISSIESLLFRARKGLQKELSEFYKKNYK